jgi:hypothetical protein
MAEEDSKSPDYLLKAHGYDNKVWELVSARNNIWNTYSKNDGVLTLYSSKITVKPRTETSAEEIRSFLDTFSRTYTPPVVCIQPPGNRTYMLEVPHMDLHLGKLGWSPESGANYDYKIAKDLYLRCIQDTINKTQGYRIEKIMLVFGSDFFHIDTPNQTTTAGTHQDTDLRGYKMFEEGFSVVVTAIDMLRQIAPVQLITIPGNHDYETSLKAAHSLHSWYRNEKDVIIDKSPFPRKYIEYGQALIGYAHGDKEKTRINRIMQVEAREAWGRTRYHEWHLGHWHSEKMQGEDIGGILIRHISSVCGPDAYHAQSGFVGSIRKAQSFVWHKEYGLEAIINSVII